MNNKGISYLQEADHYRQLAERYIIIMKGCQEQNMRPRYDIPRCESPNFDFISSI